MAPIMARMRKNGFQQFLDDNKGSTGIIMATSVFLLSAFLGLGLDATRLVSAQQKSKDALDAATLFAFRISEEGSFNPEAQAYFLDCLLYTSPSPRDLSTSRMPSSA